MQTKVVKMIMLFSLLLNALFLSTLTTQEIAITPKKTDTEKTASSTEENTSDTTVYESGHTYPLIRIVDGDTIIVGFEGTTEYVRIIGINSPEMNDPGGSQCYAQEATTHLQELARTGLVVLYFDESQGLRDSYNRLLAYVEIPSTNIDLGKQMLEDGFAREYTFNTKFSRRTDYKVAEQKAIDEKRGLWADTACK
jgi:micrococcal nuclease